MNIAFFTNNYFPYVNGVVHSIAGFKQELEKRGHNIYLFAPESTPEVEEEKVFRLKSFKIFKSAKQGFYPISVANQLKIKETIRILRALKIDIIHAHQPLFLGKIAQKCASKLSLPLVFTNHTPYHKCLNFSILDLEQFLRKQVASFLGKYCNQCDQIIVPGKSMKAILQDLGVEKPITIIPSGISLSKFKNSKRADWIRKKHNLTKDDILLLSVSRLSYEKNIIFLLLSFQQIKQSSKNIYLMIVGEGLQRKRLERLVSSLKIKNVIFTGRVDYSEISCYYKTSDIFVYPCLVDSQALVVVEAMVAGLPIVALKNSIGPKDIIRNNKTGFLVAEFEELFAQAIVKLADNIVLRRQFSQQAIQQVKQYSIEKSTSKLIRLYNKLLSQ